MFPRRGLLGNRGMPGNFNQGGGGRGGVGGLLGSLGPRDSASDYNRDFNRGQQQMAGLGYHVGQSFQQRQRMSQGPILDSNYRRGSQMPMGKRSGDMDSSWDTKRQRTDQRMDYGFNRRGGRGNDGGTEYDPSRPTEDGGQGPKRYNQRDDQRRSGGSSTREYCRTCSKWIDGSFEHHKNSTEHIEKSGRKTLPASAKGDVKGTDKQAKASVEKKEKGVKETVEPEKPKGKPEPVQEKAAEQETTDTNGTTVPEEMEEQEGTVEEESENPEYDEQVCFGREYVVPVTGFFCRLCHKFYSSEKTVYESHCHARPHYDKYIAALDHLRIKNGVASANKLSRGRGIRRGK